MKRTLIMPTKNRFLLLLFVFFSSQLMAQNLVPNPDFEGQNQCPVALDNIGLTPGGLDLIDWYSPTDGQPDYFNRCAPVITAAGVPDNLYGFQQPSNGEGYAGFTAYAPNNLRDYLTVQLSEPALEGKAYCVSFNVSLADATYIAVEELGLYFSKGQPNNILNGGVNLNFTPQINNTNGIIDNTTDWITISGTFFPSDTMRWITIGNFNDNSNTTTLDLTSPGVVGFTDVGYYYVDEVSVTELPDINTTVSIEGNTAEEFDEDLLVCEGATLTFTASAGANSDFKWTTLADPFTVIDADNEFTTSVNTASAYLLFVEDGVCTRQDTIRVNVAKVPKVDFEASASCAGYDVHLFDLSTDIIGSATYQWEFLDASGTLLATANTFGGASFLASTAGTYTVNLTINNAGDCSGTATQQITVSETCDPCAASDQIANLVPNPNVEAYTACPTELGQFNAPIVDFATPWFQPTFATSDFFNTCAAGTDVGVPGNYFGMQSPLSGNGYFGFYAKRRNDYREYLGVQLQRPLSTGKRYCVSYNVSLADSSGIAVENIGLHLSQNQILNTNTTAPLFSITPQISNTGGPIADKNNWTKISGVYTATAAMRWLTIGNFADNANTNFTSVSGNLVDDSYYYLDDIVVTELPDLTFSTEQKLEACTGTRVNVSAIGDYCSFLWIDPVTNDTLSLNSNLLVTSTDAGTQNYVVLASYGDCIVSDTVSVTYYPVPEPSFEIPLESCAGTLTIFQDQSANVAAGSTYEWVFGDGQSLVNNSGIVTHFYQNPSTYTVQLTITSPQGCIGTTSLDYEVVEECNPCDSQIGLIADGSFEANTDCPSSLAEADLLSVWEVPTEGNSPDYYDACDNNLVSVPNNFFGVQQARTGDAYIGMIGYRNLNGDIVPQDQEYISTELENVTLDPSKTYCVKMYVSLADSSDWAIDQLGFYFSNGIPTGPIAGNVLPQVFGSDIITNKTGWTEVAGVFQPTTSFDYLTIGNFTDSDSDINKVQVGNDRDGIAYYYIDDVSITEMSVSVTGPEEVTVCAGEAINLEGITNTCELYWIEEGNPDNVLSTTNTLNIIPTTSGVYQFVGSNGSCEVSQSVRVNVLPLPQFDNLPEIANVCLGDGIDLTATGFDAAVDSVVWASDINFSNPIGTPTAPFHTNTLSITPSSDVTYYTLITNTETGCSYVDSVQVIVNALPVANAGEDIIACPGETLRLGASGGDTFTWTMDPAEYDVDTILSATNIADPTLTIGADETLTFTVTVANSATGCSSTDEIVVTGRSAYNIPTATFAICSGDNTVLNTSIPSNALIYSWSPSSGLSDITVANPTCFATTSTSYRVNFIDENGCTGQAFAFVEVFPIPSAGPDITICNGATAQLSGSAGGSQYAWTYLDGSVPSDLSDPSIRNPIASPTTTTSYLLNVTYADDNGGCSRADTVVVFVNQEGFANAGADQEICAGESAQLNAVGGNTYAWTPGTGLSNANVSNPQASPTTTTTYTVEVTNSITGCVSFDEVTVTVKPEVSVEPNFTTPDLEIHCADPFVPVEICYEYDYEGCGDIFPKISTELGSNITQSGNCFTYQAAFSNARTDTATIEICTNNRVFCDEIRAVIVYCDNPPEWAQSEISVEACPSFPNVINLPQVFDELDDSLNYAIVTDGANGAAGFSGNTLVYTTNLPSFSGPDQVVVSVCDTNYPSGECDILTVNINVVANDAPSFNVPSLSFFTFQDAGLPFCVNPTDPDGDALTLSITQAPNNGTLSLTGNNCLDYEPNLGFNGSETMRIQICDDCGSCDEIEVQISVLPPNLPPVINDVSAVTEMNTPITVCQTFSDPNTGDALTVSILSNPTLGIVGLDDNNCVSFVPNLNVTGTEVIEVQVCDEFGLCATGTVTIEIELPPNEPPVVENQTFITDFNTNILICVDVFEPEGQSYTFVLQNLPVNGILQNTSLDNCYIYIPDFNYSGTDQFIVRACDPFNACDDATITVVVEEGIAGNSCPIIESGTADVNQGDAIQYCFDAIDPEGGDVNYSITGQNPPSPSGGIAKIQEDGCLIYSAPNVYEGPVEITVQACDTEDPPNCCSAVLTVNVIPVNNPPEVPDVTTTTAQGEPVRVCLNIIDPDNDPLTITVIDEPDNGTYSIDGTDCFIYTPNGPFIGPDQIVVQACDPEGLCDTGTILINVLDALEAEDDGIFGVEEGNPTTLNILANDTYPDVNTLDITITDGPTNGTVTVNADGTVTYTAADDYTGSDEFTYQICDPDLGCETAVVMVVVGNDLTAVDDFFTTPVNESILIDVINNDTYPDPDSLRVTIISQPNGIATVNATTGAITYLPNLDYVGTDTLIYEICYPNLGCDQATVVITIVDYPNAEDDASVTDEDTPVTISILGNDFDPNTSGDLTVTSILVNPSNGTVAINSDGTITYTPNTGFSGTDQLTYIVCNSIYQVCDTAVVDITVNSTVSCEVKVYKALTPNGDGFNDEFEIGGLKGCGSNLDNELFIFNRYGNIVYEEKNYGAGSWWDGTYQQSGNPLPDGTYYYVLKIPSQQFEKAGFFEIFDNQ